MRTIFFLGIACFNILLTLTPAIAAPDSCKHLAITSNEKNAVDILQEIYFLQSDMIVYQKALNKLNIQMQQIPDRRDIVAIDRYNVLVREYNSIIDRKNKLSTQYNELKKEYNNLLKNISSSNRLIFINCINSELRDLKMKTTRLNLDSLNTQANK